LDHSMLSRWLWCLLDQQFVCRWTTISAG